MSAIDRERETRNWTIAQFHEAYGGDWPKAVAEIRTAADAEVDAMREELSLLRAESRIRAAAEVPHAR